MARKPAEILSEELQRAHNGCKSWGVVCELLLLPRSKAPQLSMIARGIEGSVSREFEKELFTRMSIDPPPRRKQPRPCPNAAQVALFNELGCSTWSEVIDAGLERLQCQAKVREQFGHVMEHIKEQMNA